MTVILLSMWLATQYGFYSIVQKAGDTYFVRARVRQDLVNLVKLLDLEADVNGTDLSQSRSGWKHASTLVNAPELSATLG